MSATRQNNGDYNQAMNIFQKMKAEDKIPSHFFFNRRKLDAIHDELRNKFIEVNGMFEEYTDKQNNGDYNQAMNIFQKMKAEDKIPSHFFFNRRKLDAIHDELRNKFIEVNGMFEEYTDKCLRENNWDWAQSMNDFNFLNSEGQIPPQCFYRHEGQTIFPSNKNMMVFEFASMTNMRPQ